MSSASLPNSKKLYDELEGGIGAAFFILTFLVLLLVFCITKYMCSEESFHSLLSVFYSSFSKRQGIEYTPAAANQPAAATPQAATQQAATPQAGTQQAATPQAATPQAAPQQAANQQAATQQAASSPVLLIWTRNIPTGNYGCQTYAYYCLMAIMACLWFVSFAVDNSIFLKITTCSDIDPDDMSHVCFAVNESYRMVDCTAQQMTPVICYFSNLNIAGIGIAYSIANLCLAVVDVYYIALMKLIVKCTCCAVATAGIRIFAFGIAVIGFGAWWGVFRTYGQDIRYDYFGYGLLPMRISQSVLALVTAGIMTLLPPWNIDTMQSYCDLAVEEKACSTSYSPKSSRESLEGAVRVNMGDEQVHI